MDKSPAIENSVKWKLSDAGFTNEEGLSYEVAFNLVLNKISPPPLEKGENGPTVSSPLF